MRLIRGFLRRWRQLRKSGAALQSWLMIADSRNARIFLMEHTELLADPVQHNMEEMVQQAAGRGEYLHHLYLRRAILLDARTRGGSSKATLAACINIDGGFVVNLPEWLDKVRSDDEGLSQQGKLPQVALARTVLWEQTRKQAQSNNLASDTQSWWIIVLWRRNLSRSAKPSF